MNLSQLYYFKKLAELQHYTRAAKELFISQPTLSGSMSVLEKELGVSLFQKDGRNIQLTKYGQEFAGYVNTALDYLDKGIDTMKGYAGISDGGSISLGCIITVQTDYIPKLLNEYQTAQKLQVDFDIRQMTSMALITNLREGRFDIVFGACSEAEDLVRVPVVAQDLMVVMSDSCSLVDKEFITLEDLVDESLISYREEIPLGKSTKEFLTEANIMNVKYSFDDELILAGFAVNGVNAAIMCDTFLLHNVTGVIVKPLYNNAEERRRFCHRIYMGYSHEKYHPHCVENFIKYVSDEQILETSSDAIYID